MYTSYRNEHEVVLCKNTPYFQQEYEVFNVPTNNTSEPFEQNFKISIALIDWKYVYNWNHKFHEKNNCTLKIYLLSSYHTERKIMIWLVLKTQHNKVQFLRYNKTSHVRPWINYWCHENRGGRRPNGHSWQVIAIMTHETAWVKPNLRVELQAKVCNLDRGTRSRLKETLDCNSARRFGLNPCNLWGFIISITI